MYARSLALVAFTALTGLGLVLSSTGSAHEPQGPEKKSPNMQDPPKDSKDSISCKAVRDLELAHQLITYGRKEKHAESLLVAAQILHKNPTEPLKSQREVTGPKGDPAAQAAQAITAKGLVAEAKKIGSGPQVDALAMATEKMLQETVRGAVPSPQKDFFTIYPGQSIKWNPITFRGQERAIVDIEYLVNGRLTLEIFDQYGALIVRDNIPGHYSRCEWYPNWTGPFTIRLVNNDSIAFVCDLITN